jgi:toxic protein SymE
MSIRANVFFPRGTTTTSGGAEMNQQHELAERTPYAKARRLKVGYASGDQPGSDVPFLRLCGRWLRDAGFPIGRNVKVEVSEGRLTIEPVD